MKALTVGVHPKEVIANLSEDLLAHYTGKPLIHHYDVYQHLMDYWAETMRDDCYLIASDGWKAETTRIIEKDKKGKEKDKGWTCDLIPKALIVARYYAKEQAAIDQLTAELESVSAKLAELDAELDTKAYAHYPKLTEADIKSLTVDNKWLAALDKDIHGEMDRISPALTQRVKELAERYEAPLPKMTNRVAELEAKVNRHLAKMGFAW